MFNKNKIFHFFTTFLIQFFFKQMNPHSHWSAFGILRIFVRLPQMFWSNTLIYKEPRCNLSLSQNPMRWSGAAAIPGRASAHRWHPPPSATCSRPWPWPESLRRPGFKMTAVQPLLPGPGFAGINKIRNFREELKEQCWPIFFYFAVE